MSGICGLFNLDQAPVAQADLAAMTAMLERRGPERTGEWQVGSVCLGHTLLATTPELLFEQQPFTHDETGCVITADLRLDNRDELLRAFGLLERRESIGDAELVLRAYLEWGDKCVKRLLGDFAFAIWDPRHKTLFCARDHFGMRPLYYHHAQGQRFLFASDARAILVLPQVPYRINEGRIADFLVPELQWIDYTSTFFEDVYRLPPGHSANVTPAGLEIVEYWKPAPGPELGTMSDDDYKQGFLEVFTEAVNARLRAPTGTVGSMFSGGMDSGSIVAVAKEILSSGGGESLATFSAARRRDSGDANDCAESRAIYAALSMPSITPTLIHPDDLDNDYEQMLSDIEEPFDGDFMLLKTIYLAANRQGRRVVLDGGGGDVVLTEGTYIVRLLRSGQVKLALTEMSAARKFWQEESLTEIITRNARVAFVPEVAKKRLRWIQRRMYSKDSLKDSLISRDFAAAVDIENRFERFRNSRSIGMTPDYAVECCNTIRPNVTAGRERYSRIAAAMGAEARDPFLDKRVVEYSARLPGRFRVRDGWPKMILRELMANELPAEVLWCRGKPHLGWLYNEAVTKNALRRGDFDIAQIGEGLSDYVDAATLHNAWKTFQDGGDSEQIHAAHILWAWLRGAAQRPVVPN